MANETAPESYDLPGEFRLENLELINYRGESIDISRIYESIELYEDMFNTVMSGNISIQDANDLQQSFPIIGQERIRIAFRTVESFEILKFEFYVFEFNRMIIKQGTAGVVLSFCSKEMLTNKTTRVSRSWSNRSVKSIVSTILQDYIETEKDVNIEDTQGVQTYIAPNIYPFRAINTMLPRAKSAARPQGSAFVFFENADGFQFGSVETFMEGEPTTYTMEHKNTIKPETERKFYSVNTYQFIRQANTLDNISLGMLGSRTYGFDPVTKEIERKTFRYTEDYPKVKHLEGDSLRRKPYKDEYEFSDTPDATVKFVTTSSKRIESDYFSDNSTQSEYPPKRRFENMGYRYAQMMHYFNHVRLQIEVPGNSQLRCGNVLEIDVPSMRGEDAETEELDRYLRGKYLITSLKHKLTKTEYVTVLTLTKDSYKASHDEPIE